MLASTMQDYPLTINAIFKHGERVHHASQIITFTGDECRRATFAQVAARAARLASALKKLGVESGDRVGTFG
ncbi:MAG TPA: AMP-binding protein, partial [Blastocatellia bacterium]|nr:AMP-binding protein [Blastocatellia bacterium]